MRTLWRVLVRTVFWSYERGTWPYDIAVALILVFVFLSPRSWFHDQPQVGSLPQAAQVQLLEEDPAKATRTYRVDARLLASPVRTPEFQRDIHEAVRKSVPTLQGRTFEILQITPIRDDNGIIIYYDVALKP